MGFTFLTSLVLSSFLAALYYGGFNIGIQRDDSMEDGVITEKKYQVSHPLFLTPLIENGDIDDARRQAIVEHEGLREVLSYSGFFNINEEYNSNIFFWFFPAEICSNSAPLIIWLQGQPGESSLLGLFTENGPFSLTENGRLQRRKTSWTEPFNVLYMDSPVGTGFSFTDRQEGYADNQLAVGIHLYQALKQFFKLFPELQTNELFIASEGIGGKFATALGYAIHTMNPVAEEQMNFKGLMIFDGYLDSVRNNYIKKNNNVKNVPEKSNIMTFDDIMKAVAYEQQMEAFLEHPGMMSLNEMTRMFTQAMDFFAFLFPVKKSSNPVRLEPSGNDILSNFLNNEDIKYALHVGNRSFMSDSEIVQDYLMEEMSVTLRNVFTVLLQNYKILIANGELDMVASPESFAESLNKLNWDNRDSFAIATKEPFEVNMELAGYVKSAGNLVQVIVQDVKESVIKEQPVWTLDIVQKFVKGEEIKV